MPGHRAGGDGRHRIDLSHVVHDGLVTYPGLPAPVICDFLSREQSREHYAPGTEFQIGTIELCGNTGTYIDSPFHRYADGTDLAGLPLESLADLDGIVIDVSGQVDRNQLLPYDIAGQAVLLRTGWDRHWGTGAYFQGHPFLTAAAAAHLAAEGAALVGIDSLNIDDTSGGDRPAHSALLGAGIPVCEHLTNLAALPVQGFRFSAVPVKVAGMGTFPVRAYATIQGGRGNAGPLAGLGCPANGVSGYDGGRGVVPAFEVAGDCVVLDGGGRAGTPSLSGPWSRKASLPQTSLKAQAGMQYDRFQANARKYARSETCMKLIPLG